MDIPIQSQEGDDIPAPPQLAGIAAGYGGGNGQAANMLNHHSHGHGHGHGGIVSGSLEDHHHHPAAVSGPYNNINNNNNNNSNGNNGSTGGNKVAVRYRECQKNHAAAMGGTATDGCGEFMPSGEEGTIEALTCSACSCHRNFHRKEVDGGGGPGPGPSPTDLALDWYHSPATTQLNRIGRKVIMGHPTHKNMLAGHEPALIYPTGTLIASRGPTPHQMILPYSMAAGSLPSESDEQDQEDDEHHHHGVPTMVMTSARPTQMVPKKRFRTKFTQEQKEKMLSFAEKVGWKMQRQEESVVQQFCQEVGVKRRVLKVWMHNNKHSLAKKNINIPNVAGLNLSPTSMNVISPDINDDDNNGNP